MESSIKYATPPSSSACLCVGDCGPIGRGVYAKKNFQPGELIESVPVILIPAAEWEFIEKTILYDYCYAFGETTEDQAVALGFGSLYNHSFTPNARYVKHIEEKIINFFALRPIFIGEEITINYNGKPSSLDPLWFPVHNKI